MARPNVNMIFSVKKGPRSTSSFIGQGQFHDARQTGSNQSAHLAHHTLVLVARPTVGIANAIGRTGHLAQNVDLVCLAWKFGSSGLRRGPFPCTVAGLNRLTKP